MLLIYSLLINTVRVRYMVYKCSMTRRQNTKHKTHQCTDESNIRTECKHDLNHYFRCFNTVSGGIFYFILPSVLSPTETLTAQNYYIHRRCATASVHFDNLMMTFLGRNMYFSNNKLLKNSKKCLQK